MTVSAAADEDTTNDTATLTHSASGGSYGSVDINDVDVTVTATTARLQLLTNPSAVSEGTAISLTVTSDKQRTGMLPVRLTLAARSSSTFTAAEQCAMTLDALYGAPRKIEEVVQEDEKCRGSQFFSLLPAG